MSTDDFEYYDAHTGEGLTDGELHERYDDWLDGLSDVEIGSLTYATSRVLKEVDPIAYRTGFHDYIHFALSDGDITDEAPDEEEGE